MKTIHLMLNQMESKFNLMIQKQNCDEPSGAGKDLKDGRARCSGTQSREDDGLTFFQTSRFQSLIQS